MLDWWWTVNDTPRNRHKWNRACFQRDDVIKWKHFPRYWPFVRGIHRSPVNSPHKGQWSGALMFSLICVWINGCVNNRETGDLRSYRTHYDVRGMKHRIIAGNYVWYLIHWPLMMPHGVIEPTRNWFRLGIVAWWCQAITRLFGAKPLSEPMLTCQFGPWE